MREEWTGAPSSSQLLNMRSKVKEDKMNRNRLLNKYLLLALILTALFAMTGCRTRITNNSEVSNVYYDEDGFLSETYQMRRDELGLSTAESPIFPDLGGGETEEDFDSSEDTSLNYEPEEDTYVEPPTTTTTTSTPSTTRHYSSPSRRYSSPSNSTTTTTYKVTLNPGDGAFEGKSKGDKLTQNIQKNRSFSLPESDVVTRKNYKLSGWKDGSTTHKPGSKVTVTKDVTYTAVWEKGEEKKTEDDNKKKDTFTVTFEDGQGNVLKTQKVKKGKAATAPENPKRDGYRFKGWDKKFNKVTSNLTVKATWEEEKVEEYTITVDTKGGTLSGDIGETYEKGQSFNLPGAERDDGFTLKEWVVNGETKKVGSKVTVNENLTISAKWTVTPSYWDDIIDSVEKDKKYSNKEDSIFTQCIGEYIENPAAEDDYYAVDFAENSDKAKDAKKKLVDKGIPESKIKIFSKPPKDTDELILYKLSLYEAIYGEDLGIGAVEDATGLKSRDYFEEFK